MVGSTIDKVCEKGDIRGGSSWVVSTFVSLAIELAKLRCIISYLLAELPSDGYVVEGSKEQIATPLSRT